MRDLLTVLGIERVSVLGHSFGGFVALQAFAADLGLRAAASIAGFDFGVAQDDVSAEADGRSRYERMWGEMLAPLQGTSISPHMLSLIHI